MTKPTENGTKSARVADDCMSVSMTIEQLLALAAEDLLDGVNDFTRAQRAISEARRKNFAIFAVLSKVARRELEAAEILSEQAASAGRLSTKEIVIHAHP